MSHHQHGHGPRIPFTKRRPRYPGRKVIRVRVCDEFLEALRAHPRYCPYVQGYASGDGGTAQVLLYQLLGIDLPTTDGRTDSGPKKRGAAGQRGGRK